MDAKIRNNLVSSCYENFQQFRITLALDVLVPIVHYCSNPEIKSKAESLKENYRCMTAFLAQGVNPDQKAFELQKEVVTQGLRTLEAANRDIRLSAAEDTYAQKFAQLQRKYGNPEEAIISKWNFLPSPDERIEVQDDLFNLLWTEGIWTSAQMSRWYDFISLQPVIVARHLLGAVFLSAWEFHDTEKIALLMAMTDSSIQDIAVTAATYTILLLDKYKNYPFACEGNAQMKNFRKYVFGVQRGIMLIHWTREATKNEEDEMARVAMMKDDVEMEEFVKAKMDFVRFMMRNDLDVNLSSRPHLYPSCKFLREPSHWFLPFDKTIPFIHDFIVDSKGNVNKKLELLADNIVDCDTDKYAVFELMSKSKSASSMASSIDEEILDGVKARNDVHPYSVIRNLYRFFSFSAFKDELSSPFESLNGMWDNEAVRNLLTADQKLQISRIFKETGQTATARGTLKEIMQETGADADTLVLSADCEMQEGNDRNALFYLRQAELLDDDDMGIKTRMQQCLSRLGMDEELVILLRRMIELSPDDRTLYSALTEVFMRREMYREAMEVYFLLDYKYPEDTDVVGSIVTCALHLGEYSVASRYNNKLTGCASMLTRGHIHFLQDNWKEAIQAYKDYVMALHDNGKYYDEITKAIMEGLELVRQLGKEEREVQIMQDVILSTLPS